MFKNLQEFFQDPTTKVITVVVIAMTVGGLFLQGQESQKPPPTPRTFKRGVGALEEGDPQKAEAYNCATAELKRLAYPQDIKFGMFGVLSATYVRRYTGEITVTGRAEILGVQHEYRCVVDLSGECSADCSI